MSDYLSILIKSAGVLTIPILAYWLVSIELAPARVVFDRNGNRVAYDSAGLDIRFDDLVTVNPYSLSSAMRLPSQTDRMDEGIVTSLVDIVFGLTTVVLENEWKKFTGQYSITKSNLNTKAGQVPNFKVSRKIRTDADKEALEIDFRVHAIDALDSMGGFVYYVDCIMVNYSEAKRRQCHGKFLDYLIELKLTTLTSEGNKKDVTLNPILIPSVAVGKSIPFDKKRYHSDIILLQPGEYLTEMGVVITETNPAKVRAQKILSLWEASKDNLKKVVVSSID